MIYHTLQTQHGLVLVKKKHFRRKKPILTANILKKLSRDEEAKAAYARALELKEAIEPPPTR